MRRLINKLTGGDMWVSEDRVDEYLAAGHKLAVSSTKKAEAPIMNPPEAKEESEKQDEAPARKFAVKSRKR